MGNMTLGSGVMIASFFIAVTPIILKIIPKRQSKDQKEIHPIIMDLMKGVKASIKSNNSLIQNTNTLVQEMAAHYLLLESKVMGTHDMAHNINGIVKRNGDKIEGLEPKIDDIWAKNK